MTQKRTFVVAAVALMASAGLATAQNIYRATGGSWNSDSSWVLISGLDPDTHPVAGDTAIIDSGVTITVDSNAAAAVVTVNHSSGVLEIDPTYALTITSGSLTSGIVELDGGTFIINTGAFEVNASTTFRMKGMAPTLEINAQDGFVLKSATSRLEIVDDAFIDGTGSFKGENSNSQVIVNVGNVDGVDVTLTLNPGATMHGAFRFVRDGAGDGFASLDNQGQVKADLVGSQILLEDLDDVFDVSGSCGLSTSNWAVMSGARLRFDISPSANLNGYFYIDGDLFMGSGVSVTSNGKKLVTATPGTISGSGTFTASNCP